MTERIGDEAGLKLPQHLSVLFNRIAIAAPVEQRDVVTGFDVDDSTVTRWVVQLVRLGLVEKEVSSVDARRQVLRLTPSGAEAWHRLVGAWSGFLGRSTSEWRPRELESLLRLLAKLVNSLETRLIVETVLDEPGSLARESDELRKRRRLRGGS
jgi:DNA-binding MarR family transcriptional regulator